MTDKISCLFYYSGSVYVNSITENNIVVTGFDLSTMAPSNEYQYNKTISACISDGSSLYLTEARKLTKINSLTNFSNKIEVSNEYEVTQLALGKYIFTIRINLI